MCLKTSRFNIWTENVNVILISCSQTQRSVSTVHVGGIIPFILRLLTPQLSQRDLTIPLCINLIMRINETMKVNFYFRCLTRARLFSAVQDC